MNRIRFTLCILIIATTFSCKKDPVAEFDEAAMLENIATNLILPNYEVFNNQVTGLIDQKNNFITTTDLSTLNDLRDQFKAAYKLFQTIKMYDFGPAFDYGIKAAMNTYPVDTTKINNNIESGALSLNSAANTDAIGFPALDFLLFNGTDAEIVNRFTTDPLATNYKDYLAALIDKIQTEFTPVLAEWKSSYKATFVGRTGTDVGSSISLMFNEFVKDIELLKNAKIGIPSGQFSGGLTYPYFVEAVYSEYSLELAKESMQALWSLYKGNTGLGFDDYIVFYEEQGTSIQASEINTQFENCLSKINVLPTPFHTQIPTETAKFTETFQELKKLVAYGKTDMTSILGIVITYSDTDGD